MVRWPTVGSPELSSHVSLITDKRRDMPPLQSDLMHTFFSFTFSLQSKTASSNKAKDKKAARKAAAEKALQVQTKLKQLLQDQDLLAAFPVFNTYSRNGLNLNLKYYTAESMPNELKTWAFGLTKINIQKFYENCPGWGWNDVKKRKELEDSNARFIVATYAEAPAEEKSATDASNTTTNTNSASATHPDANTLSTPIVGQPLAFIHMRFEMEGDDPVLYVYEFHVDRAVQGRGVGRFLLQIAELISRKAGLAKIMLTVFIANFVANGLYSKLGYTLDESSPGTVDPVGNHGYEILSKSLRKPEIETAA
jgi:ribosomal protein S18 acetylase RimI-like enzyme